MAGYSILRAVPFNDQVMNIIFEVRRAFWNRICWNGTKWIQMGFDVSLVGWLDNRFEEQETLGIHPQTTWLHRAYRHCLTGWGSPSEGLIMIRMVWWEWGAFKRQLETNHSTWGNHFMPFRNKLFLCCLCHSIVPGTKRPNTVGRSSNPCLAREKQFAEGAWRTSRTLLAM